MLLENTEMNIRPLGALAVQSAAGLEKVVESIVSLATFEAEALKTGRPFDIQTINMRKARLLLDFNGASKAVDPGVMQPHLVEQLRRMRAVLAQSLAQYQAHAAAVKELVQIVVETARAQQDDGTYNVRKQR